MRLTIITTTCALAILAAPIPEADPTSQIDPHTIARGFQQNTKRDEGLDPTIFRFADTKRTEEDVEVRAIRNEGKRNAEPQPVIRPGRGGKGGRKRAEDNIEARAIRNKGKRNAEPQPVIRPSRGGKGGRKRAEDDVEARAIRNEGVSHGAKPKAKNLNARSTISNESNKRDAEPEPVVRPNKDTKRAEGDTEQAIGDLLNERAAEADPYTRKHDSYRRYAEAGITRGNGSYRRSAEPEPAVTHGGAEAGYRSQTCHPELISSRC